jgi:hypothetical protein
LKNKQQQQQQQPTTWSNETRTTWNLRRFTSYTITRQINNDDNNNNNNIETKKNNIILETKTITTNHTNIYWTGNNALRCMRRLHDTCRRYTTTNKLH